MKIIKKDFKVLYKPNRGGMTKKSTKHCTHTFWFYLLIGIFLILLVSIAFACPQGQHKIIKVIDGDTFDVEEGRIRLLGIDAYDTMSTRMIVKQRDRTGRGIFRTSRKTIIQIGQNATKFAKDTLLNKCVILESDYRDKGRYGRLLRYVKVNDLDFGTLLLERGLANVYCGDKKISKYNEYNELSEFKCNE